LSALPLLSWADTASYPRVTPGKAFVFPRDHGAHPEFRSEWWYVTGWLDGPVGFQITFFRARPEEESNNPSRFNPRQIILAHAAIADPKRGQLLTDQRAARAGFSLAHAELDRTGVWVDDRKIASIGVHLSRGVTTHGFAINIENDLQPFEWVVACGLQGVRMTSLIKETRRLAGQMPCFRKRAAYEVAQALGRRQRLVSRARLESACGVPQLAGQ
jgi:predicted secreted hydrolase